MWPIQNTRLMIKSGQDKVTIRMHGLVVVGLWGMGWGE